MYDKLIEQLNEATFDTIRRKHRSIKRLFPDFDYKTRGVERKGGLRLVNQDNTRWMFKVHSGTKDDVWYDNYILFKDVGDTLKKVVLNRRLWSKSSGKVDMRAVAREFMKRVDVEVKCTCPAFQYWGSAYILSLAKYQAKYTDDETRPPNIRNPRQYGAVCKHLDRVLKVLAFYNTTMIKWLKDFYAEDITRWEKTAQAHTAMFKDLSKDLAKRKEEAPEAEPETEAPETEEEPEVALDREEEEFDEDEEEEKKKKEKEDADDSTESS